MTHLATFFSFGQARIYEKNLLTALNSFITEETSHIDWFLFYRDLFHESVKVLMAFTKIVTIIWTKYFDKKTNNFGQVRSSQINHYILFLSLRGARNEKYLINRFWEKDKKAHFCIHKKISIKRHGENFWLRLKHFSFIFLNPWNIGWNSIVNKWRVSEKILSHTNEQTGRRSNMISEDF